VRRRRPDRPAFGEHVVPNSGEAGIGNEDVVACDIFRDIKRGLRSSCERVINDQIIRAFEGEMAMQAASRSATPSRRSISRRTSTPPSDEREPPSKRATMSFSATGDRPGSGSVESTMAGGRSGNGGDRLQQPNPMRNGLRYTRQPLMHNCG
jgi:hypothetical protein